MFKKILFFVILAGIGFGIYTGIHKIFEVLSAPKTVITTGTTITIPTTGSDIPETISLSGNTTEEPAETIENTPKEPGFFARIWKSITGWFSSTDDPKNTSLATTGLVTGSLITGTLLSGDTISGDVISTGYLSTGFFEEIISEEKEIETTGKVSLYSGTTETVTTTKTTVTATPVKKPTTTKTTTTTTTSSGKDPILDALFR